MTAILSVPDESRLILAPASSPAEAAEAPVDHPAQPVEVDVAPSNLPPSAQSRNDPRDATNPRRPRLGQAQEGRGAPHNAALARRVMPPVLDQLADLYPGLFGEVFLPLKRGIFQDLLAAHPAVLEREALKAGLAIHTRSTRYLQSVAAGLKRHDLLGEAVEDMAPEHIHQALLEVFRRRQGRTSEDLRPKLRQRIVQAFETSGLSREAYAERVHSRDEAANAMLDEVLEEAGARAAKDEALLRAFEASSQAVEVFADMYGLDPRAAAQTLDRARNRRTAGAA